MTEMDPKRIHEAVAAQGGLWTGLFDTLRERTRDVEGVTRPGWSEADQAGATLLSEQAAKLGLEVTQDEMGQVFMTLPGTDRSAPRVLAGSHLDSVPRGGNFDGYAGAVAGLSALAALKSMGVSPRADLTAIATRGEESVWYGIAYIGSRFAVGDLPWPELEALRQVESGKPLTAHLTELGHDVAAVRARAEQGAAGAGVTAANTKAYLELHIEQGPVLETMGIPLAIPTAIRGNWRYPAARCLGRYGHSGAAPVDDRRDALLATVELIHGLDRFWRERIAAGTPDTAFTVGRVHTDPGRDAMTIIPGECNFTLNMGGTTNEFMEAADALRAELAGSIAEERKVTFEFGERKGSVPVVLDEGVRTLLLNAAQGQGIDIHEMATVGHDAQVFSRAGIPAAMILVRNQHGSHNPHEAMELDDFARGVEVLTRVMVELGE